MTPAKYKWGMPQGIGEWVSTLFFAGNIYTVLQTLIQAASDGRAAFDDFNRDLSYAAWGFAICLNLILVLAMLIALTNPRGNWVASGSFFLWALGGLIASISVLQSVVDGFAFWLFGYGLILIGSAGQVFFAFYRPVPPPFALKTPPQAGSLSVWIVDLGKSSGDVFIELAQISNWGIGFLNSQVAHHLPFCLLESISQEDAKQLKALMEAKGATVEIRPTARQK